MADFTEIKNKLDKQRAEKKLIRDNLIHKVISLGEMVCRRENINYDIWSEDVAIRGAISMNKPYITVKRIQTIGMIFTENENITEINEILKKIAYGQGLELDEINFLENTYSWYEEC